MCRCTLWQSAWQSCRSAGVLCLPGDRPVSTARCKMASEPDTTLGGNPSTNSSSMPASTSGGGNDTSEGHFPRARTCVKRSAGERFSQRSFSNGWTRRARLGPCTSCTTSWWRIVAPGFSPDTRAGYARVWKLRVEPALGELRVDELSPKLLEDLYTRLASCGGRMGKPLAPSTVLKVHILLSSMLTAAARWGWISAPHAAARSRHPSLEGVGDG
jgi:hypothetical protein